MALYIDNKLIIQEALTKDGIKIICDWISLKKDGEFQTVKETPDGTILIQSLIRNLRYPTKLGGIKDPNDIDIFSELITYIHHLILLLVLY